MQILYICSQYFWIFCKLRVLPCCIPKLQISQHKSMKNDMAVQTFTDYLYHLCNKNQVNLKNVDDFGDDFIQLQTFFHFEPIIYECFFLFVSGTAARSVPPLTLAHDNMYFNQFVDRASNSVTSPEISTRIQSKK